jgi:multidrug efflux pump subunit AcrA (membrane-fusion protein)
MSRVVNKLVTVLCVSVLLVAGIGCASEAAQPELERQVATVQSGDLAITVSVDGNLVMPQAYDLLFGAPGNVEDVLVEEGDFVKEGQVLARLDDTVQRLDIMSANNNVQTKLSNLYETVPLLPQFPTVIYEKTPISSSTLDNDVTPTIPDEQHTTLYFPGDTTSTPATPGFIDDEKTISTTTKKSGISGTSIVTEIITLTDITIDPVVTDAATGWQTQTIHEHVDYVITNTYTTSQGSGDLDASYKMYYPNATALSSFFWAQDEVNRARELFQAGNYAAAASELYIASSDLESCIKIFEDTINNPKSGFGNVAPLIEEADSLTAQLYHPFATIYIRQLRQVIDLIKQGQADIETIRGLTAEGKYDEAGPVFDTLSRRVDEIRIAVIDDVNAIKTYNYLTVYGEDIGLYFYGAAEEKLSAAQKGIENGDLNSPELYDNLRIARHYIEICNAILGSNEYVLQHGLSLKAEHQYKLDLQNAVVSLENKKDDLLKTVVLAPFDGTVVSVGVKKNDVLSAMDYSSKTAVQLVDTSQIKFQGLVDEIDILKIEAGQKAMISIDAVPDKTFTGTVSFISPYGSKDTGSVVKFAVTIKLDPTDVELKGGLTATADVVVYKAEDVLLVPLTAVTTTPEGSFVAVVDEATGQFEKRQVVIGRQNYQFAEVLSGLKEGDRVLFEEKVTGAPVVTGFPRRPPSR